MSFPIIDLHCDLLLYLQNAPQRSVFDAKSRCSHPQLKDGGVKTQVLAIFSLSKPGSSQIGSAQVDIFKSLTQNHPLHFETFSPEKLSSSSDKILILPAFENARAFCEETEPMKDVLLRLQQLYEKLQHILYISLTWDGENRFGGGVGTQIGLKKDGEQLLQWMDGKKIAVDLSHTSDWLAHDIFNHIDKWSLDIPVIASHSNFRKIVDLPRNLPDILAREIIARKGIIGLNLFGPFVGLPEHKNILKHVEHALELGGTHSLCFGADFFCEEDTPMIKQKYQIEHCFFPEFENASKYPYLLQLLKDNLQLPHETLLKLSSENSERFMQNLWKAS